MHFSRPICASLWAGFFPRRCPVAFLLLGALIVGAARADELEQCRRQYLTGQYEECIRSAEAAISRQEYEEEWRAWLTRSLLALGRYEDARTAINTAISRYPSSVRLLLLGHEVFLANGEPDRARSRLSEINYRASTRMMNYQSPPDLVALGRTAVLLGADPRRVLENFYDRAKKADPGLRDAYLASAELALDKNDFELAARVLNEGGKRFASDPDFHFGLARAFEPSDRRQMIRHLDEALNLNPRHVPALLLVAEHLIDGEDYASAEETLEQVFAVNPANPDAGAYRAVIAHLANEPKGEARARERALANWPANPRVDHLIGLKLSQKYRFAEGAAHQRHALKLDASYLPAKIQLAQDLLRLGEDDAGWKLAEEVQQADGYDVIAFNLATLRESLAQFETLQDEHFIVRMHRHEAPIYGERVMALLQRARRALGEKYGVELEQPTVVEIFPNQKDFAVRTFGMPGGAGYLGVCFGRVITANSPASQTASPSNWEAVLWHEFAHVVTLSMTRNKMPRWLSEGISVYEERQENPTWGQVMNPVYRAMVLGEDLTPVGNLSAAFLAPRSGMHLQFAYYQSSLVVEFLIGRFGLEPLQAILRDLAEGVEINEAIATHTAPLEEIETAFAAFAREKAEQLAPELEWEKLPPDQLLQAGPELMAAHPKNFWVLTQHAKQLVAAKKWREAEAPLKKLLALFPNYTGSDNAYTLLAAVYRAREQPARERAILERLAALTADDLNTYLRLMELAAAERDWAAVGENAERFLAVNPLLPQPHRFLARASEDRGQNETAIAAYRQVLRLDPPDPAEAHFRLARLLHQQGDAGARRHVLQALEEAPRFRDAHRLLLEMSKNDETVRPPAVPTAPPPVAAP